MEYSYELKIPKDRVAVLIGTSGKTKRQLEKLGSCKLDVNSKEGEVTISGSDNLKLFELQSVVKAVARGFNPDTAQLLLKQDFILEIVDISDYVKDDKKHLERVRGRVIGKEGKTREMIEKLSNCFVCVYGKTVSIIGTNERADIARSAVENLLRGSPHGNVYSWLERACNDLAKREKLE